MKEFYYHETFDKSYYIEILRKLVPNIEVDTCKKLHGYDSVVLIVNERRVFKFPQRSDVFDKYKLEISVLPFLRNILNFEIPNIINLHGNMEELDNCVLEYEIMPGKNLTLARKDREIEDENLSDIGKRIGQNLQSVHAINIDELVLRGVGSFDEKKWKTEYNFVVKNCFQYFDGVQKKWVTNLYENFLKIWDKKTFSPVFVHGDIGSWHVFVDKLTVTGFIDWGDMRIDDPAVDLKWYGLDNKKLKESIEPFFEIDEYFFQRREFYKKRMAISKFIKGFMHNDEQRIKDGYLLLEKIINN